MTDHTDLIRRLAFALDSALPELDRKARLERTREAGKTLMSLTDQVRAKMAYAAVKEAFDLLGVDHE